MGHGSVAVVVLAYNNYSDTAECLASVLEQDYRDLRVYVVDNGSNDDTATRAAHDFFEVGVVETGRNLGVAGGFNAGILTALGDGADFVFILNNDTSLPSHMISELMEAGASLQGWGVLMPKILYYDDRSTIWSTGARYRCFPPAIVMRGLNQPDDGRYDGAAEIDFAPTCGLLISRETFRLVGLLDDGYFFYFDDWDYSLRVRQAGLSIQYVPTSWFYHKVSRTIQNRNRLPFFWRTWGESGARFYRRFGRPAWLSALVHLGYLALREGVINGPRSVYYFVQGIANGFRGPLTPVPHLPEHLVANGHE